MPEEEEIVAEVKPRLLEVWVPRTRLGKLVREGAITDIREVLRASQPLREVEIVDYLLPGLKEEILHTIRVQKVTDSGRRTKFRIVAVVGNEDGIVGVGKAKAKEAGTAIRKAVERAKLSLVEVKRGCGSWECRCGEPHSVPFEVTGKQGGVKVTLLPAPKGTGLVTGDVAKRILRMAGIRDVWTRTKGQTRTTINFAYAVLDALRKTNFIRLTPQLERSLGIITGSYEREEKAGGGQG